MANTRSRITKGRLFQKTVMKKFQKTYGLDDDDIRTAVGSETGVDIKLNRKARKIVGLSIECKNVQSMNIWSAIEQAKKNCYDDCVPAIVFKRGSKGANTTYICVPLDHYLSLNKIEFGS